jgi:DNA-binding response OmpR family regulator/putative methionine-R-sulfoxide reductase with GAF domain
MSGEVILVIDDSREIVKHLTEHLLPEFGYATLHAFDGDSGLKLIQENNPDLVMLDYNLPEMTGLDVLRQMVQQSINTPVVLMTGYGSELSAIEAFRLGAKDYLIKPFTIDEIAETIERALVETRLLQDNEELAEELRRVKVEMSRVTHEMNTLSRVGKAITSLLSVSKVLERVLETATYLTNAEESTIWIVDEASAELRAYGQPETGSGEISTALNLPTIKLLVDRVMQSGQPVRHSDFAEREGEMDTDHFAHAVLFVPVKLRGVTMGVLGVSSRTVLQSFSNRHQFLLSFLADYAAIALENARVFQAADQALAARLDELHMLIEITRMITSSLDLDEVVRLTIQQVHNSWNIEAVSLWWVDETEQKLKVLANVGTPAELLTEVSVPIGEGFVGHVAQTGKWLYTNDVSSHPLHYRQVDDQTGFKTRVLLCVPLLFREKVVGVMQLLNKRDGDFDDQDVERARSMAGAVAIAVTNALMFKAAGSQTQVRTATFGDQEKPQLMVDKAGDLVWMNLAAQTHLGLTTAALGSPASRMEGVPGLPEILFSSAEVSNDEAQVYISPDGMSWSVTITPVPGHGRMFVLQPTGELASTSYQPCDIRELVIDVVDERQEYASAKEVDLVLTAADDIGFVEGDSRQLRQAIGGLVDTAIKFSRQAERVRVCASNEAENILIKVQDCGAAFSNSELRQVFDETAQTDETPLGADTSLELGRLRSVAAAHRGKVWAERQDNNGSTIYLQLPMMPPSS